MDQGDSHGGGKGHRFLMLGVGGKRGIEVGFGGFMPEQLKGWSRHHPRDGGSLWVEPVSGGRSGLHVWRVESEVSTRHLSGDADSAVRHAVWGQEHVWAEGVNLGVVGVRMVFQALRLERSQSR